MQRLRSIARLAPWLPTKCPAACPQHTLLFERPAMSLRTRKLGPTQRPSRGSREKGFEVKVRRFGRSWSGGLGNRAHAEKTQIKARVTYRVSCACQTWIIPRRLCSRAGISCLKRTYGFAIDDFICWYCSEPRLAFGRTVVLRYRYELEARRLAPATINLRLAAVRRLAYEASDNGLLSPRMISGVPVPCYAIPLEANWNKSNSCSDIARSRRPSVILDLVRDLWMPSTTG